MIRPFSPLWRTRFASRPPCFTPVAQRATIAAFRIAPTLRDTTLEVGTDVTGHINAGPKEGIIFIDSTYLSPLCAAQY